MAKNEPQGTRMSHIVLGTAQFGLNYGINNVQGQVSLEDAATILKEARHHDIDTLDTAIAYGNSEQRLGEIGLDGWQVITKLPPVPKDCPDVRSWILSSVEQSLLRLGTVRIHGLLLHQPAQLLTEHGDLINSALVRLRQEGLVEKIGISIYDPSELAPILSRYPVDLIQAPFNILDQRLIQSGWMDRLLEMGIELHARSIFLQGLLLMNSPERMRKFPRWRSLWTRYDNWLRETHRSPLEFCLAHALSHTAIHRVVLGIDSPTQLREIVHAAKSPVLALPEDLSTSDVELLNPSSWPKS
jgi:aryl-alcohol dehydrogenase-like predicted oxidoreductase